MIPPNIIVSAGRRFDYLFETLTSFVKHNDPNHFGEVYILDDRSPMSERVAMLKIAQDCFGDKAHLITFDKHGFFDYVDKFNMIKNLIGDSDFVFLLEDDWKSIDSININKHIKYLIDNPQLDQIMFSQRFDLQWDEIKAKTDINADYWVNPFPERYKHFYEVRDGNLMWQEVIVQHYGNNPSIYRKRVFEGRYFIKDHGWEMNYADRYPDTLQYFTKKNTFIHIGKTSLVDIIPKP